MKNFLIFLLVAPSALAAVPSSRQKALEILQLPTENQEALVQKQPRRIYEDFLSVAFDSKLPMTTRWKALMAAARIKKEKSTPDLVKASKKPEWFMKTAALMALTEYDPIQSDEVAKNLLRDKALVVRSAAVDVLAKNHTGVLERKILWKELFETYNFKNKKSLWIRPQIIEILAKAPLDQETDHFSKLLNESEVHVQLAAIKGLQKITGIKLGNQATSSNDLVKMWRQKIN